MNYFVLRFLLFITVLAVSKVSAQTVTNDSARLITLKASDHYNRSGIYTFFWGKHYRREWNTPVTVQKVMLDTLKGGLVPYQTGGSRQTKSIRARDRNGREYAFRSVDKTFGGALPDIAKGSFVENLVNDQITISHPYGALIVAPLAEAAGIYHANPELLYVPKQPALGKYNDSTGNILYMLEQRPDEDWSTAPNFGYSKNIISTEKMLDKILKDNDNSVDQRAFVKARLFDMLIGDWGRHEDQWRWASFKDGKKTVYAPVPRDRDNAFTKFDGFMLRFMIHAAKAYHLQTFDTRLKRVSKFNFPARNLDHHLMNEVTLEEWISVAEDLRTRLTDHVIDDAVKKLPAEVYPISGEEIARKLKARRELLPQWAATYFKFLNKEVEITGTGDNEYFEVKRLSDKETEVNIYKISKEDKVKKKPYYHRVFKNDQTNEIRLYGIDGNDEYALKGDVRKSVKIRMIGGPGRDTYTDESHVKGPSHKTKLYDNPGNDIIKKTKETSITTSKDSSINKYEYAYFEYNQKHIKPLLFYNNEDRVYVGLAYITQKHKWRKPRFANTQYIDVKYSLSQKAVSSTYRSDFYKLVGQWNLHNYINYDQVRWTNYYDLGNETVLSTKDRDFYRIRSEEFIAKTNLDRVFSNRHRISFGIQYQTYHILRDEDRHLLKAGYGFTPAMYGHDDFGGAEALYVYQHINDSVLPVKGIAFQIGANYIDNLKRSSNSTGLYHAETNIYLPLSKKFGIVARAGGATLSGDPQYFQYNRIGGTETLRGYQRNRFYGNSTFFNQNELRFISNVRSKIMNGKIGLFALFDQGRVWVNGEKSNAWHTSYGGGIIISPFNKLSLKAAYAVSPEDANIHITLMKPF